MPDERELTADEHEEIESRLPEAYRLCGLDPELAPAPAAIVSAINELARQLRTGARDKERAAELSADLGCLLGQQWHREFGWDWRLVTLGEHEGYGLVPADRRHAYFPIEDIYGQLTREDDELNLMLLFNLVAAGSLPSASDYQYAVLS